MSDPDDRGATDATSGADLAADTAVRATDIAGWWQAELPDHWNYAIPSGGALTTLALRAARAQVPEPALRVRSATALFCAPVPQGPIATRVEVLRQGRVAAQVRVTVCPGTVQEAAARAAAGESTAGAGLELVATFARDRRRPAPAGAASSNPAGAPGGPSGAGEIDVQDAAFPDVPPPQECEHIADALPGPARAWHDRLRFFRQVDVRLADGRPWAIPDDADPPPSRRPARQARWFRYKHPQRDADGWLDPLAIPPLADTMPGALFQRVSWRDRVELHAPSLDLTVHFLDPTRAEWLLVSTYARRARDGYATAEVEVWSEHRELVAYGTQTMILRRRLRRR